MEFSGPSAAIKGLYEGKTNIICEVERTAKLQEKCIELLLWNAYSIHGSKAHDKHIACLTYPHISALCWVKQ
jgi:prephenate dehydrogenase